MCCRGAFKCSAQSTSFRAGERSLSTRGHLDRRPQMIAPELDSKECLPQDAGAKNPSWQTMCRRHRREEYVKDLPQTIPTSTKSCSLLMHAFLAAAWPSCADARPITPGQRDSALKTCKQMQENVPKHYCSTVWMCRRPAIVSGTRRNGGLCASGSLLRELLDETPLGHHGAFQHQKKL